MTRHFIFSLIFCAFFSCTLISNAESLSSKESVTEMDLQEDNGRASTTLHKEAKSTNTSELFAKVIEMEEQIRELNGRLQYSEHLHEKLLKKVEELYVRKGPALGKASSGSNTHIQTSKNNKTSQAPDSDFLQSISLVENGKNAEAIDLLNSYLQKIKEQKKQLKNEGELYYWLAKAHMNNKSSDKAAHYFTKSYRHYSKVKSKDILVNLIETLAIGKKYKKICPLLHKLDDQYLNSIDTDQKNKIQALEKTHCLKE